MLMGCFRDGFGIAAKLEREHETSLRGHELFLQSNGRELLGFSLMMHLQNSILEMHPETLALLLASS